MNLSNSIFTFVFALFISLSSFSSAFAYENNAAINVEPLPYSTKFVLNFENEKQEKVKVKIYDSNSRLIFSEVLGKESQIQRIYDMTAVGEGTYTVSIEGEFYKETKTVTINGKLKNNFIAAFSPVVINNKVFASIEDNKGVVKLMLTDNNGNVLYEETVSEQNMERSFNLEKLARGTYFLQVVGQDKVSYETYQVN